MRFIKNIHSRKKLIYSILFTLFIFSIIVRLFGVVTQSFPFTYDVGRDLIAAREIATLENFTLIGPTTGLEGLFYGPSWYYVLATMYHPLFGDPTLIAGLIALTGVAVVVLSFLLGNTIGGRFFSVVWAGLIAFSPEIVGLTNQIWSPSLIPIFWIISFFILYNIFLKKRVILHFFLLGLICSLIVDMEIVVGLLYSTGIFFGIVVAHRQVISVKNILAGIAGFVLVLMPRIVFDIRHENILSRSFIDGMSHMIFEGGSGGSVTPISQKIVILFSVWSDTIVVGNNILGALMLILTVGFSFIFYKYGNERIKYFLKITLITLTVSMVGILFMGHDIWSHYLVMFPLLFVTWVAIVLALGFRVKKYKYLFFFLALGLVIINMNIFNRFSEYTNPLWEGDAAVYRNQIAAIDYVYKKSERYPFKYIVYTPSVHDYPYRYLFDWYGEKNYNKVPDENNPQLLFVVLEPDHEQPQRLTDWLQIREDDGEIVEVAILKGGIIVQTRRLTEE